MEDGGSTEGNAADGRRPFAEVAGAAADEGGGGGGWGRRKSESTPGAKEVGRAADGRRKLLGDWERKRPGWHGSVFWVVAILNAMWLGKNMVMAEQRFAAVKEGKEEWSPNRKRASKKEGGTSVGRGKLVAPRGAEAVKFTQGWHAGGKEEGRGRCEV